MKSIVCEGFPLWSETYGALLHTVFHVVTPYFMASFPVNEVMVLPQKLLECHSKPQPIDYHNIIIDYPHSGYSTQPAIACQNYTHTSKTMGWEE